MLQDPPHLHSLLHGHVIVSADEEGLVTLSPEHYKRYRVSPKTLEQCERCYCWGNIHAQMIKDVGGALKNKLFVTGNPREGFPLQIIYFLRHLPHP